MALGNAHVIECNGPPLSAPAFVGMHWVDTASQCHYISVGTSNVSDWRKVDLGESVQEVNAPGSSVTSIQTVPLANFCAIKYHICLFNESEDKWKALDLHVSKQTGSTIEFNIYNVLGFPLSVSAQFAVVGSDGVLTVTNNETFDLTARFRAELI